jgi:hypothetical protein
MKRRARLPGCAALRSTLACPRAESRSRFDVAETVTRRLDEASAVLKLRMFTMNEEICGTTRGQGFVHLEVRGRGHAEF